MIEAFIFGLIGAFISRWHGGAFFHSPKIIKNAVWASPFALCSLFALLPYTSFLASILAATIVFIFCFLGKATGHGGWMDLGTWDEERKDERLEFLIKSLKKHLPEYWYDALGLSVAGLAAVLAASIAIGIQNPLYGLLIAIGGIMKAPAYMIGWSLFPKQDFDGEDEIFTDFNEATEIGEALAGFFAYFPLGLAFAAVF